MGPIHVHTASHADVPEEAHTTACPSEPCQETAGSSPAPSLPWELQANVLSYLGAADIRSVELCSRGWRDIVAFREMWKKQFLYRCRKDDWRVPQSVRPPCWKRFYFQSVRERGLDVEAKIPASSATVQWKVSLPTHADPFRTRSREFTFSNDALGDPIRWQLEVELERGYPLPTQPSSAQHVPEPVGAMLHPSPTVPSSASSGSAPHAAPLASIMGVGGGGGASSSPARDSSVARNRAKQGGKQALQKVPHRQVGLIRLWTTNTWTTDTTSHYYGSHCTISIRDPLSRFDVQEEVAVDIDNSAALEFDTAYLDPCRDLLVRVNLTLALELSIPLKPFYELISPKNTADSDTVKVGYCKALFEVARCKRKRGGMFVKEEDRDVSQLVALAADANSSAALRVEVFQALFNLIGPTSILLQPGLVVDILSVCFQCLRRLPVPFDYHSAQILGDPLTGVRDPSTAGLLAQNALGTVFNLLVHPLCSSACSATNLYAVARLLQDATYRMCHFSVITVLLTVLSWKKLPPQLLQPLELATIAFMTENNPLDSDCTGVAWDESDVAAFFIPLLQARPVICVMFATWCIAKYYFPHTPPAVE